MTGHLRLQARVVVAVALLLAALAPPSVTDAAPPEYRHPAFQPVWERADLPVEQGLTSRSWLWGPDLRESRSLAVEPPVQEPFLESPGGMRTVQYFEKARMEWTAAPPDLSVVTNGLLVVEMVSGREQRGFDTFVNRQPALETPIGDPKEVNPGSPSYAAFAPIASIGANIDANVAPDRTGQIVLEALDANGQRTTLASSPDASVTYSVYDKSVTGIGLGHNIANKFWDFFQLRGPVYESGQVVEGQVIDWLFAMGLPITEPYWVRSRVGGVEKWVLVQLFERRALTYTPDNPPGFQVEMANVGIHYYRWRYPTAEPVPYRVAYAAERGAMTVTTSAFATLVGTTLRFPAEGYALVSGNATAVDAGHCRIAVGYATDLLVLPVQESRRDFRQVMRPRQEVSTSYLIGPLPAGDQYLAFMLASVSGACTVQDRSVTAVYVPADTPTAAAWAVDAFVTEQTEFQIVASTIAMLTRPGSLLVSGGATAVPVAGSANHCQIAVGTRNSAGLQVASGSVRSYQLENDGTAVSDVTTTYVLGPFGPGTHEIVFLLRSKQGTPCRLDGRAVTAIYTPAQQVTTVSDPSAEQTDSFFLTGGVAAHAVVETLPETAGWFVATGGATDWIPDNAHPTCRIGLGYATSAGNLDTVGGAQRGHGPLQGFESEVTTTYALGPFTPGPRNLYFQFASDAAGKACGLRERSLTVLFVPYDWIGRPPAGYIS